MQIRPIGTVKSQFTTNTPAEEIRRQPCQIIIAPEFEPGLLGLTPGADILVLFHLNQITPEQVALQLHPRHNPENPLRGVFATRTQFRPNPIGATVAHLEAIEGNTLTVSRLDTLDGTPIIDIKPYAPFFDEDTERQQLESYTVKSLEEAREGIDRLDAMILHLLGERYKFVQQVANFKQTVADIAAPERQRAVIQNRREMGAAKGLDPDVIEAMYQLLIDHFIERQKEIITNR